MFCYCIIGPLSQNVYPNSNAISTQSNQVNGTSEIQTNIPIDITSISSKQTNGSLFTPNRGVSQILNYSNQNYKLIDADKSVMEISSNSNETPFKVETSEIISNTERSMESDSSVMENTSLNDRLTMIEKQVLDIISSNETLFRVETSEIISNTERSMEAESPVMDNTSINDRLTLVEKPVMDVISLDERSTKAEISMIGNTSCDERSVTVEKPLMDIISSGESLMDVEAQAVEINSTDVNMNNIEKDGRQETTPKRTAWTLPAVEMIESPVSIFFFC